MTTHYISFDDDDDTPIYAPERPQFDDQGDPVPVTFDPPIEEPSRPPDWIREDRLQTLRRFLEALCGKDSCDVQEIGRKLLLVSWLCNVRSFESQKEIAQTLKISEGRVSQLLREISQDFPSMGRLKHRQKLKVTP